MAFVLQMAFACMNSINSDDLLIAIQLFLQQIENEHPQAGQSICLKIEQDFLAELVRALGVRLDHPLDVQTDKLLRSPLIQRCFSLQAAISYKGEKENRNLASKIAWTLLNLREISLCFAFAYANNRDSDLHKLGTYSDSSPFFQKLKIYRCLHSDGQTCRVVHGFNGLYS